MKNTERREIWGILGGMGPLASAEFVHTIYQETISGTDQNSPTVILLSNPAIPDRTEYLLTGQENALLEVFSNSVGQLIAAGATRIVIACFTIHLLVPRLPESWQKKIISLVDLAMESVLQSKRKHLLLCSIGTKKMGLFQRHPLWQKAKDLIVVPDDDDQALIHKMIYEIKNNQQGIHYINFTESLLVKYEVDSYLAGCSEIHILAKHHERITGRDRRAFCIDPLSEIVSSMAPLAAGAIS
jgi:aspartate racemase